MKIDYGYYSLFLIAGLLSIFISKAEASIKAIPRSYIVEYTENDDAKHDQHSSINQDLSVYKEMYRIHHTYSSAVFRGMSLTLRDEPVESFIKGNNKLNAKMASYTSTSDKHHPVLNELKNHPSIKTIYPIYEVPRPQWMPNSRNIEQTFPYSNKDTQISEIHEKLKITGEDVLVGILDSGIDYSHPALGGGFGKGYKVRMGKNLVPAFDDEKHDLKPRGKDDPFDPCTDGEAGHGTHVSGIIAGYDAEKNFTGIAPNATLGMWRIFGCEGGAGEDTVIKALEMAYEAGCNVINLSLGIGNGWPEDAMSVVAERISNKGVIVVGVAGNQGDDGIYSQNSPATARSVMAVASMDNSYYPTSALTISEFPDKYFLYSYSSNTTFFPNSTLANPFKGGSLSYGCKNDTTITKENAKGKTLLVKRGVCTFDEKLEMAQEVGATSVLFYDPKNDPTAIIVAKTEKKNLPCAGIDFNTATSILNYFKDNADKESVEIIFPLEKFIAVPVTAGQISDFSSTGPTYELDLKPSITGIGGDVFSTLPLKVEDGWGVRSGTSMAAPHLAGINALVYEYYKKSGMNVTSKFIFEKLQNHAKLLNAKDLKSLENPLVQGAGLVQPYSAIMSKIHVSPAQISFNDTTSLTEYKTHSLNVTNMDDYPLLVRIENIPTSSIESYANYSTFVIAEPVIKNGTVKVDLEFSPSHTSIILPPLSTTEIKVAVKLPDLTQLKYHYQMYGGFVVIKDVNKNNEAIATVPYFGVLGKMIDLPVFDKGYPYLASSKTLKDRVSPDKPYEFDRKRESESELSLVIRLLHGSASVELKLFNATSKEFIGNLAGGPWIYNQRNTLQDADYTSEVAWNGNIIPKNQIDNESPGTDDKSVQVGEGTYFILIRALKHFGDPNNTNDWEEWKSGSINVKN